MLHRYDRQGAQSFAPPQDLQSAWDLFLPHINRFSTIGQASLSSIGLVMQDSGGKGA